MDHIVLFLISVAVIGVLLSAVLLKGYKVPDGSNEDIQDVAVDVPRESLGFMDGLLFGLGFTLGVFLMGLVLSFVGFVLFSSLLTSLFSFAQ